MMMFMGLAAINSQANLLFGVFGLMIGILAVSYFILSAMWKGVRKGRKRRQKPDPTWEFQGDETDGSGDDEGGAS